MATLTKNLSEYDKQTIPNAKGMVFAIVQAEWNAEITDNLSKGAKLALLDCGVREKDILFIKVPGAFELPLGAQYILSTYKKVDAVICLGCVIQGETRHFDFVCQGATQGIMDVSVKYNKPVIFGLLTDNNIQQSRDRSGGRYGNKGIEAAISAIKMVALKKSLK
jgi:6,7-dimethyl-8-ribityllumazine synthase